MKNKMKILKRVIRKMKFIWQRIYHGFGDDDLWNLDITIAKFILPRLKVVIK